MSKTRIILALSLVICIAFTVQAIAATGDSLTPTKEKGKAVGDATTGVKAKEDPAAKKQVTGTTPTKADKKTAGEADMTVKPKDPKAKASAPPASLTPTKEKGKAVGDATSTATPKQ